MKTNNFGVRDLFLMVALAAGCSFFVPQALSQQQPPAAGDAGAQTANVPARITEAVDEKNLVTLKGNVHPLARLEFDRGAAPPDLRMDRMLLVLKRNPAQEAALQKLLDDQQDKSSPSYRRWLTPDQFGQQFGPADSDIQTVTEWLQSHGFRITQVSKGRTVIEFSGTANRVQEAFHTTIRKYTVNEAEHWANAVDPQIPAALSPVVAGIFTLHNFYKTPQSQIADAQTTAKVKPGTRPEFTSSSGQHALVPADYYTIYGFNPLQISTNAKIAIVGRSNINLQDVTYFHFWTFDQAASAQVIVNGADPGDLGGGEEGEAVLDTTWAGAVAPSAWLALVVSASTVTTDGVDLSELYIIDNNLADVMSESFGDCESNSTSAQQAGIVTLAQQAAAQGITYVVSAGDSGAAGCDDPHTETLASHPISVNVLASTPYTVAVGGTMFNENGHNSSYWTTTNVQQTLGSAISYIPEDVWNEACISGASGCTKAGIWAGGGGASTFVTKPSWQAGVPGIPSDGARDLPDVSLTAAGHDPYLLCLRGSCVPNSQGQISFAGASGTSASTPAFAGIMALVGQKTLVRLGQPNYVLYRLAAAENLSQCNASSTASLPASTCVFNDVTVGNNAVPGESGYGTSGAKYPSGTGYDLATGLGSVNVTALINQWSTVTFNPTTTTFSISPTMATHGDPLNVSVSVTPNSGTGAPSGTVWLLQSGYPNGNFVGDNTADTFTLGAQGTFTGVTHLLPGGTYQVNTHYVGDGTYAGSDSAPPVQVTIQAENTTTTFSVLTTNASGNFVPFTGGPYGTPVYYQAHVSGQSGYGVPGAYVNFYDNNGYGSGAYLDKQGNALTLPLTQIASGAHSITAAYYGDNSFNTSANLTPITFTISQIATTTSLTSQQSSQSLLLTATVNASGTGSAPTGLITFSSGSTVLGTAYLTNGTTSGSLTQATATFDGTQLPPGQYSVTARYPGDANYVASNSAPVALNLVADFAVSSRGFTSQTVTAGQTAQYVNDISVTPFFGYSSPVMLVCAVPAPATTCSVNPPSLTTSSGPNIASVSVTTTARTTAILHSPRWRPPFVISIWLATILASLLCMLLIFLARTRQPRLASALALAVLITFAWLEVAGCGGGSSAVNPGPPNPPPVVSGTLAGTYTVTVTATSGNTTHTTTLQLIVN
jgi:hypothetical protein